MLPPRERAPNLDVAKLAVFDIAVVLGGPAKAENRGANCQLDAGAIANSAGVRKQTDWLAGRDQLLERARQLVPVEHSCHWGSDTRAPHELPRLHAHHQFDTPWRG
jgi:hypothetical protein